MNPRYGDPGTVWDSSVSSSGPVVSCCALLADHTSGIEDVPAICVRLTIVHLFLSVFSCDVDYLVYMCTAEPLARFVFTCFLLLGSFLAAVWTEVPTIVKSFRSDNGAYSFSGFFGIFRIGCAVTPSSATHFRLLMHQKLGAAEECQKNK